jgi:hypothetical protein
MKTVPTAIRRLANKAAHAAGIAHETTERTRLLAELETLRRAGAGIPEMQAHLATRATQPRQPVASTSARRAFSLLEAECTEDQRRRALGVGGYQFFNSRVGLYRLVSHADKKPAIG